MSVGYNPKDSLVMDQSLKVQEVDLSGNDQALYSLSNYSGSAMVFIREPVNSVYLVRLKVDSSNTWTEFQAASIAIVDSKSSSAFPNTTSGINEMGVAVSDQGAILVNGAAISISSISAANPSVITTSSPHGLLSGQSITISGSNSTPLVNNSYVVTVLSPTTFSIPVNVTVSGSAGSFYDFTALNPNDILMVKYVVQEHL